MDTHGDEDSDSSFGDSREENMSLRTLKNIKLSMNDSKSKTCATATEKMTKTIVKVRRQNNSDEVKQHDEGIYREKDLKNSRKRRNGRNMGRNRKRGPNATNPKKEAADIEHKWLQRQTNTISIAS